MKEKLDEILQLLNSIEENLHLEQTTIDTPCSTVEEISTELIKIAGRIDFLRLYQIQFFIENIDDIELSNKNFIKEFFRDFWLFNVSYLGSRNIPFDIVNEIIEESKKYDFNVLSKTITEYLLKDFESIQKYRARLGEKFDSLEVYTKSYLYKNLDKILLEKLEDKLINHLNLVNEFLTEYINCFNNYLEGLNFIIVKTKEYFSSLSVNGKNIFEIRNKILENENKAKRLFLMNFLRCLNENNRNKILEDYEEKIVEEVDKEQKIAFKIQKEIEELEELSQFGKNNVQEDKKSIK